MVQWVKNLTAGAWVATEARVPSPGLKDPVVGFSVWPRELSYAVGAAVKNKEKKKKIPTRLCLSWSCPPF